ncbi:MAG: cyclase family protein [Halobacteriota archaeon]|nr:cyclase family protein [Halobacteriota archaeon]
MELIDVSLSISESMVIYKGDPEVKIEELKDISSDGVKLSKISMGLHSGTHIDSPSHFLEDGGSIDSLNLESFVGDARVFELTSVEKSIEESDLSVFEIQSGDILLFKTTNSNLYKTNTFTKDFVHLGQSAAEYLIKKKVKTVGIDYLSIEKSGSKDHPVHKLLLSNKITIIEGLNLGDVMPGEYTLFCLPLKIQGVEASPARCILVK